MYQIGERNLICVSHVEYSKEVAYSICEQVGLDLHEAGHLKWKKVMSDTAKAAY